MVDSKHAKVLLAIADRVAERLNVRYKFDADSEHFGVEFYRGPQRIVGEAFTILNSATPGNLVLDAADDDEAMEHCLPSEWRAAICRELLTEIKGTPFEVAAENIEYSRKVYAAELLHPTVVDKIQNHMTLAFVLGVRHGDQSLGLVDAGDETRAQQLTDVLKSNGFAVNRVPVVALPTPEIALAWAMAKKRRKGKA